MNTLLLILMAVAVLPLFAVAAQTGKSLGRSLAFNAATHPNGVTSLKAEEAVSTRHLVVKRGAAATGVLICGAGAVPLGVINDEADADDVSLGTPKAIQLLGVTPGTILMVAASAIAIDSDVYAIGSGKVDNLAQAASGDYRVGRAVTAAGAANELIEVAHTLPTDVKA